MIKINKKTKKWLIFSGLKVLELMGVGLYIFFMWLNTLWTRNLENGLSFSHEKIGMGFGAWFISFFSVILEILVICCLVYLIYKWIEKNIEIAEDIADSQSKRKR